MSQIEEKAAAIIGQAEEKAKDLLETAKQAANELEKSHEHSVEVAADALRKVFGENEEAKRFVDVTRIPLICASIISLNSGVKDLQKAMSEQNVVMATQGVIIKIMCIAVGIIATAAVGVGFKAIYDIAVSFINLPK